MDPKELIEFLDLGDVKSIDEAKEKFNAKFAPKSDLDDVNRRLAESTGKMTGAATTLLKRYGGLESKEIEGKKWEEVAEIAFSKLQGQIKELEGKTGQSNEAALIDLNKKLEKIAKERDDYKTASETLQGAYEKDKGEWEGKFKNYKITQVRDAAKAKVAQKFKSDMTKAEQIAWETETSSLILDFDDKENSFVKDKEGKRLPNPNKAGSFFSLEEVLEHKANELNLIKKNNGNGGNQVHPMFTAQNNNGSNNGSNQNQNPQNGRTLHPALNKK